MSELARLNKILTEMNEQIEYWDTEIAHGKADQLLIDTLEILSENNEYRNIVNEIIERYDSVDKWYA